MTNADLWFGKFVPLWNHIELDSVDSPRQQGASYEQNGQNHVRKRSGEIHDLHITADMSKDVLTYEIQLF